MKKSAKILSSLTAIAMSASLVVGGTYALFTSESKVNVAVTSGKVKVLATIDDDFLTYSMGEQTAVNGVFYNRGTASFNGESELVLDRVAPGDMVKFDINVDNQSNIDVQYRVSMNVEGDLKNALVAEVDGVEFKSGQASAWTFDAWEDNTATVDFEIPVSVEFPATCGDEYQESSAVITFKVEAVQANGLVTVATLAELNTAINSGRGAVLEADIDVGGSLVLKEDVALYGNGHTISNVQLTMQDGATVENVVFDGVTTANGSLIYAHDASVTIKNCTFKNAAWDAIQATQKTVDGVTVVIDGCTFDNGATAAYRYVHVEVDPALRADNNIKVVLTNNKFVDVDKCTNDGITIAGVYEENLTIAGNTATADRKATALKEVWIGSKPVDAWVMYTGEVFESVVAKQAPALVRTAAALKDALAQDKDVELAANIEVNGNISLKEGAVLNGNGHTLSKVQLYVADNCTVENVVFDGTTAETLSHIYAHNVSVTVKNCVFMNAGYEAIQATQATNGSVTIVIDGCKFVNGANASYRYVHVEVTDTALRDNNNVKLVLTNNNFVDVDKCEEDGITIAGVFAENLTFAGNTATAVSEATATAEVWVGWKVAGAWVMYTGDVFAKIN